MLSWLKIVCAVDLGESSRTTIEHAAHLARRYDAELTLVHVWRGGRLMPDRQTEVPPVLTPDDERELAGKLEAMRRDAERLAGRQVRSVLTVGSPALEIASFAAEEKADLIVVGVRKRRPFERAVLGSVAEAVVRHARCAVLVARPPQDWGD
jgi:nucleotide-binding universal stress UspA family protein